MIFQDFKLFSIPIIDNVLQGSVLSNNNKKEREVVTKIALEKVGLIDKFELPTEKIYTMLTTELDSQGINLSGGEMQKLAISRILSHSHDFIILDEPFSYMAAQSEDKMTTEIFQKYKNKTISVIIFCNSCLL